MEEDITWRDAPSGDEMIRMRLAQCEAILAQVTTGVAVLEPTREGDEATLSLTMVNEVAAAYFGRIGDLSDPIEDTERGFRASGLFDLALLVSLTGQEHMQEALHAPGAAAAGQLIDLAITPLADGAVSVTFDDVTQWARSPEAG